MTKHGSLPAEDDGTPLDGGRQRLLALEERLRETEMALRVSNGKLRMALDVGRLGSWERDMETGEVTGTPSFKATLGLPADASLTYDDLQEIFHPDDVERIRQAITFSVKTKTDFQVEHRVMRGDGRIGRVLVRGGAIYENDKPVRLVGVMQDIAEREKAKEEIHLAQRRQEFLLELNDQIGNTDDPHVIMEIAAQKLANFLKVDYTGYGEVYEDRGVIIVERDWSKGIVSNEGYIQPISQIPSNVIELYKAGTPLVTNDTLTDPTVSDPQMQAIYASANVRTSISTPVLRNGQLKAIFYASSSQPRVWSSEDIALVEDVADRTWIAIEKARAERGMRESEARFKIIAEALPALVWIITPDLDLTYANDRWLEFSGLPASESLGDSWKHWVHPDDVARVSGEMAIARKNESAHTTEIRYRAKDGTYRWHLIQAGPLHSATGEFKGWAGTSVDIHDLKVTEEALRRSEEQLRLAFEAARMGDWRLDAATDIISLSDRSAEIFGLPPGSSFTRAQLRDHIYPPDLQRMMEAMQQAVQNRTQFSVEFRVKRMSDKVQIWVAAQGQGTYHPDGTPSGMTGVIHDITDRKHTEERQQLLIRELHHRVKNTLATVQAIVGSTARTASSIDEFYQGFVGRIVSLARTHNLLTEDLWQKADLAELVKTELGPYEDEARNRVIIEGPSVELPSEAAVPIGMAIHELTTNAAKHGALSTFGGQVEVRWRIEPGEDRPMLHFSWSEKGGPRATAPVRQGFGSRLLQRVLTTQLQAHVNMDFREEGLRFTMVMPIPGEPPLFNPDQ